VVNDPAQRKALYERLLLALKDYEDPWAQAVKQPAVRREYEVIKIKEITAEVVS
jgi:nitrite reductase (NADH) large subunit